MAELVLFHHAQGLTAGCLSFAAAIRSAGHVVHAPDLYDGLTFGELADGMRHFQQLTLETILERSRLAVETLPATLVYAGFSLGVMPAQMLTQTRPGAKGALFFHSALPLAAFDEAWPEEVPLQIHTMADDALGDVDVARDLADAAAGAELFLYPGDRHLFTDSSLPSYDEEATRLLQRRVLAFLRDIA